jgi:hypothetical protein
MGLLLIIHLLSALFTVVFAVYTGYHIFHRYSLQHRIDKIKSRMMPLLIGKTPRVQIIEKLKKEGFSEHELVELYDKFNSEYFQNKTP